MRARLTPPIRRKAAAGVIPSRRAPRATISAATATGSSTPPPSAASPTRRKCSSITRATITARGSPIPWKWSQIARSLARALGLDEDLAEAAALAHDLGHPPFGHAGERALEACTKDFGGFDHNAQALRIVTDLERRYAEFDGLNLTWETLEGLVKHNGPLTDRAGRAVGRYAAHGVPAPILAYSRIQDLELWSYASAEAQAAAIADDIAYDAHDIDDGLRADLFALDDISGVAMVGDILREIDARYAGLDAGPPRARDGTPHHHPHDRGRDRREPPASGGAGAGFGGRGARGARRRSSPSRPPCRRPTPTSRASSIRACTATHA